jgi:hypothetical protein
MILWLTTTEISRHRAVTARERVADPQPTPKQHLAVRCSNDLKSQLCGVFTKSKSGAF